jgi:hypothetical protein
MLYEGELASSFILRLVSFPHSNWDVHPLPCPWLNHYPRAPMAHRVVASGCIEERYEIIVLSYVFQCQKTYHITRLSLFLKNFGGSGGIQPDSL